MSLVVTVSIGVAVVLGITGHGSVLTYALGPIGWKELHAVRGGSEGGGCLTGTMNCTSQTIPCPCVEGTNPQVNNYDNWYSQVFSNNALIYGPALNQKSSHVYSQVDCLGVQPCVVYTVRNHSVCIPGSSCSASDFEHYPEVHCVRRFVTGVASVQVGFITGTCLDP